MKNLLSMTCLTLTAMGIAGCSVQSAGTGTKQATGGDLSGTIVIAGSSTVAPVSQAICEEFGAKHSGVRYDLAVTGTGPGFERFQKGECDINNASRSIKESEKEACAANGIEYIELKIGLDGLSVVVSQDNDFCKALTTSELKQIWQPESKVKKWSDVRDGWPDEPIELYGPDTHSGTFDFFTEEINGKVGSRSDYSPSSDDNVLVRGVAGDKYALGYFGYAYLNQNLDKIKAVAVSPTDSPDDAVLPTAETVESGEYTPLSRPLYIYVRKEALKRPEVREFVEYYVSDAGIKKVEADYVRPSAETLEETRNRLSTALEE